MHTIHFEPVGKQFLCREGWTILEAVQEAGIELLALCGGTGSCGRCRVKVRGERLPPLAEKERSLLSEREIDAGYRLACRTPVQSDIVVYIPETSRPRPQRLQTEGQETPLACCPPVRKLLLDLPPPTLEDTRADVARIVEALQVDAGIDLERVDPHLLPDIGPVLRAGNWRATATLRGGELMHLQAGNTTGRLHGIAVDLGSTKLAVYLVDLQTGCILTAQGVPNPQIAYGEDILSRISYALEHPGGGRRLQEVVIEALNGAIVSLCASHDITPSDVLEITLVGNTAMHHLFLGLPTGQLARSPFVPIVARPLEVKAWTLGLDAAPGAVVYCPPGVAGFVGSDHVAMLLSSRLYELEGTHLGIDIGTNTEISLKRGDTLRAVSCASGPAFEGAAICWGMKAAPGAIDRVWLEDTQTIHFSTIDDAPPVGLCGSGILDGVATMLQAHLLDRRGHIHPQGPGIRIGEEGLPELVLAESSGGRPITITQQDVQQIQLAKGAIRSGIEVLLDAEGIGPHDLDTIILAGAFGTMIDPLSALHIGMLPAVEPARILQVGNAAGMGAREVLASTARRRDGERLAERIEYLELTVYPRYSRFYAHALRF